MSDYVNDCIKGIHEAFAKRLHDDFMTASEPIKYNRKLKKWERMAMKLQWWIPRIERHEEGILFSVDRRRCFTPKNYYPVNRVVVCGIRTVIGDTE